jgi:hypothetical protein
MTPMMLTTSIEKGNVAHTVIKHHGASAIPTMPTVGITREGKAARTIWHQRR